MISRKWASRILAVLFPAVLIGSLMPFRAKDFLGTMQRHVVVSFLGRTLILNPHRIEHFALFALIAWLQEALAHSHRTRVLAVFSATGLALLVEVGESVIYHNPMEWQDVGDDLVGVAAGILIAMLWRRWSGSSNPAAGEK